MDNFIFYFFTRQPGVFGYSGRDRWNTDGVFGEQTGQTIPHAHNVAHLLGLLHIDRNNRHLLDGFEADHLLVGVDTLSHDHFHLVVRHNARRVDTSLRNLPHEVSEREKNTCFGHGPQCGKNKKPERSFSFDISLFIFTIFFFSSFSGAETLPAAFVRRWVT